MTTAARHWLGQLSWDWLGVVPFFIFALMFLIVPTAFLMVGAFQDGDGNFTLVNLANLFQPTIYSAFRISIEVSAASALGGAFIGFFLAYAAVLGGLPGWIRPTVMTFCGVASNFAGVPLAFAFIATLGRVGSGHDAPRQILRFQHLQHGLQSPELLGPRADLSLLPDPADGADAGAGARRAEARLARGLVDPRGDRLAVLALRRAAGAVAEHARRDAAALRQCLRRRGDGLCA